MLRAGGTARIVVPDGELYLELYHRSRSDPDTRFPGSPSSGTVSETGITPMVVVNRIMRAFDHLFVYDYDTLELMLKRAGFVEIQKQSFRHGRDQKLLIDYEKRRGNSLYVEAVAPEGGGISSPRFNVADLESYLAGGAPP